MAADKDLGRSAEAARPVSQPNRSGIAVIVRSGEVLLSIVIEVTNRYPVRSDTDRHCGRTAEASEPISESHRGCGVVQREAGVGADEILLAVVVEIPDCNRAGPVADVDAG